MNKRDPKLVVLAFNECIKSRSIDALSAMMADGCSFIDSGNGVQTGKAGNVNGWADFFSRCPDYRNHFMMLESKGN